MLNQVAPVPAATTINFSNTGASYSFFRDAACALSSNSATLPAGTSNATVYFKSPLGNSATVNAVSAPLIPASQLETVVQPPTSLVFSSVAPTPPLLAGLCFLATVEARSTLGPATLISAAPVSLQSVTPGGLRFYSDPSCTTALTGVTILTGDSSASFYVKAISGGSNAIDATASFGAATLNFNVIPVVRRGQCSFSGLGAITCPISPVHQATDKTLLMYQAGSASTNPLDSEVRCKLATPDFLTCVRSGNTSGATTVSWQTAELLSGLAVQRLSAPTCPPAQANVPLSPAVDPASSFVLSSFSGIGLNFDGEDMVTARLAANGTVVQLDSISGQACTGYEVQVVELSGVNTMRGATLGFNPGVRRVNVMGLPPASTNTVLFNQTLGDGAIAPATSMCNLFVRSELSGSSALLFNRGGDNPNAGACSLVALGETAWERVDFGSRGRVQSFTVTLTGSSLDVPIVAVDATRTLVFSGGQAPGGQATGETALDNANEDNIGPVLARFELLSNTLVRVTRGRNQSTGTFTFYVVELEP